MFDISQIGKILKQTNRLSMPSNINNTLPITITVKKQLSQNEYLLELGRKNIKTYSQIKLELNTKYKAIIQQTDTKINIKNLTKIPNIFLNFPDSLELPSLDLSKDSFAQTDKNYKNFLLHQLSQAHSKEEFLFFSQLFLAFNQGIRHFLINDQRKALFQTKYKKNKIKFYGYFENLGGVGGEIYLADSIYLNLMVEFQNSLELLKANLKNLKGLKVNIKKETTKPLFDIKNDTNLFNIKV